MTMLEPWWVSECRPIEWATVWQFWMTNELRPYSRRSMRVFSFRRCCQLTDMANLFMLQIKGSKENTLCSLPLKMLSIASCTESWQRLFATSWERNGELAKNTCRKCDFASDIIHSFVSSSTRRDATAAVAVLSWTGCAWELGSVEGTWWAACTTLDLGLGGRWQDRPVISTSLTAWSVVRN